MATGRVKEELLMKHATIIQNQLMTPNMRSRQSTTEDEQEYLMLMKYMNFSLKKVAKSNFYLNLVHQLENNVDLKNKFSKALGSHTHMSLVIYQLGGIQFSFTHQLRFSLALLLKRDFSHMIDSLQVHISSSNINEIEVRVMNDLGCNIVIDDKNWVNYTVQKPTLLYLPYPNSETLANLIEENWCPATRLNQLVILSNSMEGIVARIGCLVKGADETYVCVSERLPPKYERLRYVWVVQKFCEEIGIDEQMRNLYREVYWDHEDYIDFNDEYRECLIYYKYRSNWAFSSFGLHFFNLDSATDLKRLLPGFPSSIKLPAECVMKNQGCLMDEDSIVESLRLIKDIHDIMKELEESDFYNCIRNNLTKPEIKQMISHMLGSEKNIQMVLYGVGSIEQNYDSQIQFALALLLKQNSDVPIGDIEIFDKRLTVADKIAMSDMGCTVLDLDLKNIWRRVKQPTFFFIYKADCKQISSIFEANFCPSRLNKICVLSRHSDNSYNQYDSGLSRRNRHLVVDHSMIRLNYLCYERTLLKHTISFQIGEDVEINNYFHIRFMLKFYVVDSYTDLHSHLPRATIRDTIKCHNMRDYDVRDDYSDQVTSSYNYIKNLIHARFNCNDESIESDEDSADDENDANGNDEDSADDENNANGNADSDDEDDSDDDENLNYLESRWPVRLRSTWSRPQSGWLKLNFSGNQHSKGFGGLIHDEDGKLLMSYAGSIRDPEENANNEALRHGSRCILAYFESKKLIIEGDSLPLVLWSNGLFSHVCKHDNALYEITKARRGRNWAFVHVYPEANKMAEDMAIRGAELRETCHIWDHQGGLTSVENLTA